MSLSATSITDSGQGGVGIYTNLLFAILVESALADIIVLVLLVLCIVRAIKHNLY